MGKQQQLKNRELLERIKLLENDVQLLAQEIVSIKSATHEHSISPETILHLADIIKNDIVTSSIQEQEQEQEQPRVEEVTL